MKNLITTIITAILMLRAYELLNNYAAALAVAIAIYVITTIAVTELSDTIKGNKGDWNVKQTYLIFGAKKIKNS